MIPFQNHKLDLVYASLCWIRDVLWLGPVGPGAVAAAIHSNSKTHLESRCCLQAIVIYIV